MPKPGQQAFNPLAAAKSVVSSAARQVMGLPVTSQPTKAAGQLQRPDRPLSAPKLRGVSALVTQDRLPSLSMRRASALSAVLHVLGPIALAITFLLVVLILSWVMHFNFWDWFKPKTPQDMTFTLVEDTHVKRPEHPLFKGNTNQHAGGQHHREQPLNPAKEQAAHPPAKPAKPVALSTQPKPPQQVQKPETQPVEPKPMKTETQKQPVPQPDTVPAIAKPAKEPKPEPAKPAVQKTPSVSQANQEPVQVSTRSADFGISTSAPQPASAGNPQEGKAKDAGVDVAQDVDYGPFMADLQKRISRNWIPPRGMESRKVLLLFYVQRDGKVVKVEVEKSSGDQAADRSAIEAVQVSAPFMALPPQIKEDLLPVEFTFDYNVLNPKNAKKAMKW